VVTVALISVIPLMASFLLLQKYWQGGPALGSVKQYRSRHIAHLT
jgi:multiple sugar transport system permease protein